MKRLIIVAILLILSCCDFAEACNPCIVSREVLTISRTECSVYRRGDGLGFHVGGFNNVKGRIRKTK